MSERQVEPGTAGEEEPGEANPGTKSGDETLGKKSWGISATEAGEW